jgi:hypothetical protein
VIASAFRRTPDLPAAFIAPARHAEGRKAAVIGLDGVTTPRFPAAIVDAPRSSMDYAIGIALALAVSTWAALAGLDRDRAFYPTLLVVIASYYVLFAVIGGVVRAVLVESAVTVAFAAIAVVGFRRTLWIVAVAMAAHGVFDAVHGSLVDNPGVPAWWPAFCLAYDVTAAGVIAWLLSRRPGLARAP